MADINMCNRFDFISGGRVVYKGTQFTEYEEVEQPKPDEPEEKKFDGSSLTGKVLGAVAAAGCVAAAFGLVAVWGASAFLSGGGTAAAAPLVWQGFAFLMAAAPIAWGAGKAINDQYNQDMASPKDGEWGTYAKLGIGDPVVVGAQDVVIGLAVGSALAGAGRLMGKLIKPKVTVTGARNLTSKQYLEQESKAEKMYESIRNSSTDVSSIAKNTGMPESRVQRIKDHVFNNEHILYKGEKAKFDPDFEMGAAWNRLESGNYVKTDLDLLEHEIFESKFEGIFKTDYTTAHGATISSGRIWDPE